jgi:hypothetical protein
MVTIQLTILHGGLKLHKMANIPPSEEKETRFMCLTCSDKLCKTWVFQGIPDEEKLLKRYAKI